MAWRPQNDFEEEIVASQQEFDFIYGYGDLTTTGETATAATTDLHFMPRPAAHLRYAQLKLEHKHNVDSSPQGKTLDLIGVVQQMAGTKKVDELPELSDWYDCDGGTGDRAQAEAETIAMLRKLGVRSSVVDDNKLSTSGLMDRPVKDFIINHNGRRSTPLLLHPKYFDLTDNSPPQAPDSTFSSAVDVGNINRQELAPQHTEGRLRCNEEDRLVKNISNLNIASERKQPWEPRFKPKKSNSPWRYIQDSNPSGREDEATSEAKMTKYLSQRSQVEFYTAKDLYKKKRAKADETKSSTKSKKS